MRKQKKHRTKRPEQDPRRHNKIDRAIEVAKVKARGRLREWMHEAGGDR